MPPGLGEVDVVLPLLHGTYGEDGTIQGLLEMAGVRYAGAGVFASAAGMDKEYMKLLFAARGLPIGPYVVVRDRDWTGRLEAERKRVLDEIGELGWPVFVKPARGGSSIGTSRAADPDELEAAIEEARRYDRKVLVEAAIDGVEVECAVLEGIDGGPTEASVPGQVDGGPALDVVRLRGQVPGGGHRGWRSPRRSPAGAIGGCRRCRAPPSTRSRARAWPGWTASTPPDGDVLVNEINTMPGMTPTSGFPMMWAATGLPLPALIDRIIADRAGQAETARGSCAAAHAGRWSAGPAPARRPARYRRRWSGRASASLQARCQGRPSTARQR